jgi:DNA-binding GntR family transcriptional regulator
MLPSIPVAGDNNPDSVYDRVVQHIFFSGAVAPGTKVVEKRLADQLGVSRIPIRETLRRLAGQGLLVGDQNGEGGVRVRKYTAEDIRQLYELREMLEGGAARAAARAATDTDVARMEMVCQQMQTEVGDYGSKHWADLDHDFHAALAEASHNERIARALQCLLTECHYLFYLYPSHYGRPKPSPEAVNELMQNVVDQHRSLLHVICSGDAETAELRAREHMRISNARYTQVLIARDLAR